MAQPTRSPSNFQKFVIQRSLSSLDIAGEYAKHLAIFHNQYFEEGGDDPLSIGDESLCLSQGEDSLGGSMDFVRSFDDEDPMVVKSPSKASSSVTVLPELGSGAMNSSVTNQKTKTIIELSIDEAECYPLSIMKMLNYIIEGCDVIVLGDENTISDFSNFTVEVLSTIRHSDCGMEKILELHSWNSRKLNWDSLTSNPSNNSIIASLCQSLGSLYFAHLREQELDQDVRGMAEGAPDDPEPTENRFKYHSFAPDVLFLHIAQILTSNEAVEEKSAMLTVGSMRAKKNK